MTTTLNNSYLVKVFTWGREIKIAQNPVHVVCNRPHGRLDKLVCRTLLNRYNTYYFHVDWFRSKGHFTNYVDSYIGTYMKKSCNCIDTKWFYKIFLANWTSVQRFATYLELRSHLAIGNAIVVSLCHDLIFFIGGIHKLAEVWRVRNLF